MAVPVRCCVRIIIKNRPGHDIERIVPTRGTTYILDIPFQRRPYSTIESAQLRGHVGEVGCLSSLMERRTPIIGCSLMSTGISGTLLICLGKIGLPIFIQGRVIHPLVTSIHRPRICIYIHRKGDPQRRSLCLVIEHRIVALLFAVMDERMRHHHLVRIAGNAITEP